MAFLLKLKADAKKAARPPALPRPEKPPFLPDESSTPPEESMPENVGQNRSILVVDDSAVVLKAFELKLKASGFSVTTTSSAAAVASSAEAAQAALIILDINFPSSSGPEWSGFTVMQWLRRFPELANIPVILISGEDRDTHKEKALAEGAVAFFQKPVNYRELLAVILRALNLQK
jgi:two-component system KDP operon response regulator KdpE